MRVAKGFSAAMSIAGSVMVFTPLLPLGVGMLAGGAGIGVTTATGDAIGQNVQKQDLRKGLDKLSECEQRCLLQLEALVTASRGIGDTASARRSETSRTHAVRARPRYAAEGARSGMTHSACSKVMKSDPSALHTCERMTTPAESSTQTG